MSEEYNQNQIIRKDAQSCFVESLNDAFGIGKIHFGFSTYDVSKPVGKRQINNIPIYISVGEFLELHRKLVCGELRFLMQNKKKSGDMKPLYESMGGTSADRLKEQNRPRSDGMSQSRIVQLVAGSKVDLLFIATSGPGETTDTGLIKPKFGNKPESRVSVAMAFETFSELILTTYAHYMAWLGAFYMRNSKPEAKPKQKNADSGTEKDEPPF